MKFLRIPHLAGAALAVALSAFPPPVIAQTAPKDPGWPRVFEKDGKTLTIYQPQVDSWDGYTNLHFHCAIAVDGVTTDQQYGMVEEDASTVTDQATRTVVITPVKRTVTFANRPDAEVIELRAAVDQLAPPNKANVISLDRIVAYLDPAAQPLQRTVDLNLNPPTIYYSSRPAVLVMFTGAPRFKPVTPGKPDLTFAINSNWDILYDAASQHYFLLDGDAWLTAPDPLKGPWTPVGALPPSFSSLPANANWAAAREHIPAKLNIHSPVVFVSTKPAELIVTQGQPSYNAIKGTALMRVSNSDSTVFKDTADNSFYLLVAGRWFRAAGINGPWTAASKDLPSDFAKIPSDSGSAFVRASVPGTREAQQAVLLASVPTTTTVNTATPAVQVTYDGTPQFQPIPGTTVQSAVNSPYSVFLADGGYYCCNQGVWFSAAAASGPWTYCTSVPSSIYNIPPSSPMHNVTYVGVQSSSPSSVTYDQTGGYSGEYVGSNGILMYGAGMADAATNADNSGDGYYYPNYPSYYSYGCGALYDHAYGGYYNAAEDYGPYGGVAKAAAYNPATGTYSRGEAAYGPYGSASAKQAYNPYTDTYAQSAHVNTAAGSASRGYVQHGDEAAYGAARTSTYGSAAAVKTSEGSGAAAYSTKNGQGAVAKTSSGNYYADKNGNVYMKDSSGTWCNYSGGSWHKMSGTPAQASANTSRPTETAAAEPQSQHPASMSSQALDSQEQMRREGSQESERVSQYQSRGGGRR